MHRFYSGEFFNFECIRLLGTAPYGGSEVCEFLEAVAHIKENNPLSWHEAWSEQAKSAEHIALRALHYGHRKVARMAFLRASNYSRASAYMMVGSGHGKSDTRVVPILHKTVDLFRQAIPLFDELVQLLDIPYDGTSLPGYLYLPSCQSRLPGKIPVLINVVGADSIQEEIYYMLPAEGPSLGYAVITFEGPGQGLTLHEHNIPMRPDWEIVLKHVIDFLVKLAAEKSDLALDMDRIAVAGASLGGYFALRGALDHRVRACIAIDPVYDLWDFATKHVSTTLIKSWERGWMTDRILNNTIWIGTLLSFKMSWEIATTARFLGVTKPTEILREMKKYTLRQDKDTSYIDRLSCAVFVTGATDSLYLDPDDHTAMVFNKLRRPDKELWVSNVPSQGSLQAKMGALTLCNQRVFQFLDQQFGISREPKVGSAVQHHFKQFTAHALQTGRGALIPIYSLIQKSRPYTILPMISNPSRLSALMDVLNRKALTV